MRCRTFFAFVIVALFPILCFQSVEADPSLARELQSSDSQVPPDPLDLNKNWWSYFEEGGEKLPERISAFKDKLEKLKETLREEEHQSILKLIDQVVFYIDIYHQKKLYSYNEQHSSLQLLPTYSVDQLLKVNRSLHAAESYASNEKDKLSAEKYKLGKILDREDELASLYQKSAQASFIKLKKGLELVNERLDQAITEIDLNNTQKKIAFWDTEQTRLSQELKHAQKNIDFKGETEQTLRKALEDVEKKIDKEETLLNEYKQKAFYEQRQSLEEGWTCCVWDKKVLTQSISTEIYRMHKLLAELKYHLYVFAQDPEKFSISDLQTIISRFNRKLQEKLLTVRQWERKITDEQTRMGSEVANSYQNDDKFADLNSAIMSIHIELDQALLNVRELKTLIQSAEILLKNLESRIIKSKGIHQTWWMLIQQQASYSIEKILSVANITLFRIHTESFTIWSLTRALLLVLFSLGISTLIRKTFINKKYVQKRISPSTQYIIGRTLHYFFILMGIMAALSSLGIDFTKFLIVLGALGVGIGLGLQSTINNIFSGFLLLFQRNIKIGDIIQLDEEMRGRVLEINLQNTHIKSFEGVDLIVPNAQLTSHLLNNWTLDDSCRRYRIPFKVAYGTDKDFVRAIAIEAAKNVPSVMKNDLCYPDPQVWFKSMGEYAMELELVAWVDVNISLPNDVAKSSLLWELETALTKHGIEIPVPQRDISIKHKEGAYDSGRTSLKRYGKNGSQVVPTWL